MLKSIPGALAILLFVDVTLGDMVARDATSAACSFITASLGSSLVKSAGIEYTETAAGAWNVFNAESTPTCIVYPTEASHVQTAMAAIYSYGADYAVQAGSHSAMVGWNTCVVLLCFHSVKHTC